MNDLLLLKKRLNVKLSERELSDEEENKEKQNSKQRQRRRRENVDVCEQNTNIMLPGLWLDYKQHFIFQLRCQIQEISTIFNHSQTLPVLMLRLKYFSLKFSGLFPFFRYFEIVVQARHSSKKRIQKNFSLNECFTEQS